MIELSAIRVHQWLPEWEEVDYDASIHRRKPPAHFYLLSISASHLRQLSGIQRRTVAGRRRRVEDLGIQRAHDVERSNEIARFIRHGFPWSTLSGRQREDREFADLKKPGWLPTAVVVNILLPEDTRDDNQVAERDLVRITDHPNSSTIALPGSADSGWRPRGLPPIEVIDGQHRLWALENAPEEYELPVVAFHGLDRSWQAYLFYTINISPKRINASLAFDLYPLLRTEDWLEQFDGHSVYRETRAQELTEALWSHNASPWNGRINMLGSRGRRMVTQSSWIRSLLTTLVKSWSGRRVQVGGLFGAPVGSNKTVLPWSRAQQAAFLIYSWVSLVTAIDDLHPPWIIELEEFDLLESELIALESTDSLLNSDMGVRGFLYTVNDLCYVAADRLALHEWRMTAVAIPSFDDEVDQALASLEEHPIGTYLSELSGCLAAYDWRSSKAPGLSEEDRQLKARFRGGTGYRELRRDLLVHVSQSPDAELAKAAKQLRNRLRL